MAFRKIVIPGFRRGGLWGARAAGVSKDAKAVSRPKQKLPARVATDRQPFCQTLVGTV
jgi:hypothetical protein